MKKKKKILKIVIISLCIILLIIAILLFIAFKKYKQEQGQKTPEQIKQEQIQEAQIKDLKTKNEVQRMQQYLVTYLKYIEQKQYDKAYELLYPECKEHYYPDLDFFIAYVENTYYDIMRIDFQDMQRQGEYYILTVELVDITDNLNSKEQKFIIYEKAANDFTLSFQAR